MKVVTWLRLEADFTANGGLKNIRVAAYHQRPPRREGVFVKVELDVPDDAFLPLVAKLDVPAEHLQVVARTLEPAA